MTGARPACGFRGCRRKREWVVVQTKHDDRLDEYRVYTVLCSRHAASAACGTGATILREVSE